MKKTILITFSAIILLLAGFLLYFDIRSTFDLKRHFAFDYEVVANSDSYQEFVFEDLYAEESGSGYALQKLSKSKKLLHEKGIVTEDREMEHVEIDYNTVTDETYFFQLRKDGDDFYAVRQNSLNNDSLGGMWQMLKNDEVLFEKELYFGSDGPIHDWRIIDSKPAFTFSYLCEKDKVSPDSVIEGDLIDGKYIVCSDIYYNGDFIGEKYKFINPYYLFSFEGKIGFVAQENDKYRVHFDGKFITPPFDKIHAYNCCATQQIVPTVYSNGVLVFYGTREEKHLIVEVDLTK